mmetsp:Transcript_30484/g.98255  ORF Transcript_30484/g.98255 Transcript_30484/m.98255 type:complete len:271 (+) Transcript_30484:40-852(+)
MVSTTNIVVVVLASCATGFLLPYGPPPKALRSAAVSVEQATEFANELARVHEMNLEAAAKARAAAKAEFAAKIAQLEAELAALQAEALNKGPEAPPAFATVHAHLAEVGPTSLFNEVLPQEDAPIAQEEEAKLEEAPFVIVDSTPSSFAAVGNDDAMEPEEAPVDSTPSFLDEEETSTPFHAFVAEVGPRTLRLQVEEAPETLVLGAREVTTTEEPLFVVEDDAVPTPDDAADIIHPSYAARVENVVALTSRWGDEELLRITALPALVAA